MLDDEEICTLFELDPWNESTFGVLKDPSGFGLFAADINLGEITPGAFLSFEGRVITNSQLTNSQLTKDQTNNQRILF